MLPLSGADEIHPREAEASPSKAPLRVWVLDLPPAGPAPHHDMQEGAELLASLENLHAVMVTGEVEVDRNRRRLDRTSHPALEFETVIEFLRRRTPLPDRHRGMGCDDPPRAPGLAQRLLEPLPPLFAQPFPICVNENQADPLTQLDDLDAALGHAPIDDELRHHLPLQSGTLLGGKIVIPQHRVDGNHVPTGLGDMAG